MEYALWIIIMIALIVVEVSTTNLVCIWFAVGALAAVIAKLSGLELMGQSIVFVLVSAISLILTKPLVKKIRKNGSHATNADRVIGKYGIVTEEITDDKFAGKVKVAGQEWSAVTENGSEIPKNCKILVKSISGVKLIVEVVRFESEDIKVTAKTAE